MYNTQKGATQKSGTRKKVHYEKSSKKVKLENSGT